MPTGFVCAIDQGTTGTRSVVVDDGGRVVGQDYRRHEQHYPSPGWVEHDPREIREATAETIETALADAGIEGEDLVAVGVTNQRETTVCWDAETGEPLHRAIVWQDRRTTERIEALDDDIRERIRERTGLRADTYFSASKAEWLLENAGEELRERGAEGAVRIGTVDAWLLDWLTGEHATDVTNASRTMLFDVRSGEWDPDLCDAFGVPLAALPEVHPSSDPEAFGYTDPSGPFGARVPVTGVLGDQQAALFGQGCFSAGEAKNTYGTGSFLLANAGTDADVRVDGLLTTVAYQIGDGPIVYALEGSIFATGAAVEWLSDVGLLEDAADSERVAREVDTTDDVYVVPAFAGLGAPHWDARARGTVLGLTRGTRRPHLVRATLESTAFQTREVLEAAAAAGVEVDALRIDGGAVENDLLCQLQADLCGLDVERAAVTESTALGAAYAAGLAVGVWDSTDDVRELRATDRRFEPTTDRKQRRRRAKRWSEAVERARGWAREGSEGAAGG